jgi:hypothetical protein
MDKWRIKKERTELGQGEKQTRLVQGKQQQSNARPRTFSLSLRKQSAGTRHASHLLLSFRVSLRLASEKYRKHIGFMLNNNIRIKLVQDLDYFCYRTGALSLIKGMREDATRDDIIDALYVRQKIEIAEQEIAAGRGIPQAKVEEIFRTWDE